MSQDVFGYNITAAPFARIISNEYAAITMASGDVSLIQSFDAAYQHQVKPFFSIGQVGLSWVSGQPQGQVSIDRAAGDGGFWKWFGQGKCGQIGSFKFNATQGQLCADNVGGGGSINFSGGIVQGVKANSRAGQIEIMEGVTILIQGASSS